MVWPNFVSRCLIGGSLIIGSLVASLAARADWTPVPGRVLSQMVAGSTVVIDAPMGFKLPIQHADDGSMTGEAGGLSFYLGSATDTGRWWIAGDRLCYKWARWFKSDTRCMTIRRDGNRIEWEKEDGESGTASLTLRKVQPSTQQVAEAAPPKAPAAAQTSTVKPRAGHLATTPAAVTETNPSPPVSLLPPKAATAAPAKPAPVARPSIAAIDAPKASMPTRAAAALPAAKAAPAAGPRIAMQQSAPPYRVGGPPPPAYRVISVAADDVLNVRQGPSAEHPAIAALAPEAHGVRVIGPCQGDWCFVRHQDIVGWVHRYYLEEMQTGASR